MTPHRAAIVVLLGALLAVWAVDTPATTAADLPDDTAGLLLTDQRFVVGAGEPIRLQYELDGDTSAIEDILLEDLTPVPPEDDTSETDTDADGTHIDDASVGGTDVDDAGDDAGENDSADGEAVDDGRPAVPELGPPRAWVSVRAHQPIRERGGVARVLAGATGPTIDELHVPLRDLLRSGPDGWTLDLEVATTAGHAATLENEPGGDPDRPDDGAVGERQDPSGDEADADDHPALHLPDPGLHPISVQVRTTDGRTLARDITFIERVADEAERPLRHQPFGISVIASLADPGPEPDRLALVEARSRLVEIAQLGEALPGGLTVAIPPVIAAELTDDDLGDRVRLALRGSEILAAPRLSFDPSSAVAAGEADAFTRELRAGEDVLAGAFADTTVSRSAWLWNDPLSLAGGALLRDLGIPLLVVPFEEYFRLENALPVEFTDPSLLHTVVLPGEATMAVAMIHPVSELLTPDLIDPRSPTAIAVEVVATLMATRLQLPDAPRVAVLSTPWLDVPDADVIAAIARLVDDHPDVRIRPLSFVPSSTDAMFVNGRRRDVGLPMSAGPDIGERSRLIAHTRELAASYGSMLPDDDPRHARWDDELDRLLSTWFTDPEVVERIDDVSTEIVQIADMIHPPEGYTFTLTGVSSELTLRITNTGSTALRVQLRPDAPKLAFPDNTKDVVLAPGTNNITMPVTVLSNGNFPVTIDVLTPYDERPVVDPIMLRARATALTGLGQVLTGGALLVLASWWYSHFRSRRRLRSALAKRHHPSITAEPLTGG